MLEINCFKHRKVNLKLLVQFVRNDMGDKYYVTEDSLYHEDTPDIVFKFSSKVRDGVACVTISCETLNFIENVKTSSVETTPVHEFSLPIKKCLDANGIDLDYVNDCTASLFHDFGFDGAVEEVMNFFEKSLVSRGHDITKCNPKEFNIDIGFGNIPFIMMFFRRSWDGKEELEITCNYGGLRDNRIMGDILTVPLHEAEPVIFAEDMIEHTLGKIEHYMNICKDTAAKYPEDFMGNMNTVNG